MVDDAVVVIALLDVHREGVVVVDRVDEFEQMEHVDPDDDFLVATIVILKVFGAQEEVHEDRMRFVHVDDPHTIGLERDVRFEQNVFQRRHQRSKR